MIQGVEGGLRRRLDHLERRGLDLLAARHRRRAVRRALTWAAPASAIGPLLLLLVAPFVAPTVVSALVATLGAPLVAAVVGYRRARADARRPRSAGLALLDHRLRLNDRLQTADEFERLGHRTAFQEAALLEAAPWVARAQDGAIDDEGAPLRFGRSRLWLWPAAGLICLGAALVAPQWSGGAAAGRAGPATSAILSRASTASPDAPVTRFPSPSGAPDPSATTRERGAAEPSSQGVFGVRLTTAFKRLAASLSSSGGSASAEEPARPAVASLAAASGEGKGRGGQGAAGAGGSRSSGAQDAEPMSPRDRSEPVGGETAANDDAGQQAADDARSALASGRQNAPSASRPQQAQDGSGQPQSGEGQQPGRSRRGDQSQANGQQSGGQGENGSQSGPEGGPKKGRGVSSLILATPMQDRLGGMASPGRTRTTTRDGEPQPLPAAGVTAQDRRAASGRAERTAVQAMSVQEQRVTRDYFNARNGGGR